MARQNNHRDCKGREIVIMRHLVPILLLAGIASASQSGDRVYTADQTSNTVSVIDPATNTMLGVIRL